MELVRGIRHVRRYPKPVVAIGMFDGVHVGHARILARCVATARRIGGTSMVLTFWPHPRKVDRIYSLDHKVAIMGRLGIDVCIFMRFTRAVANLRAEDFIRSVIAGRIGAAHVMVGDNFRFGRGQQGNADTLRRYARQWGYKLTAFPIHTIGGAPVSSTRIRDCVSSGRFAEAERLLGRKVSLLGMVVRGRAVGRTLGYPTANIKPRHEVVPPDGIYAVTAEVDGKKFPGICYKGTRPTFGRGGAPSVEVHLFGFTGSIYGKQAEIVFLKKIRDQKKFPSPAALSAAIRDDVAAAKKFLSLS